MQGSDARVANPLLDLLFDDPGVGRCLVAPDGTVLRVNDAWLRATGFSLDEVLGADLVALFPETRDMALALHARARAGHRVEVPRHAQRVNGRVTWLQGSIDPVPMQGGTGLLAVVREVGADAADVREDVTDLREDLDDDDRAVRELEAAILEHDRQMRLFEGIFSTTPDFVYAFDLDGRFLYANRRLLEVWGMELSEVVGKTHREIGYEQWEHDLHLREIAEVVATKRPLKAEIPFRAPRTGIAGVYEYIYSPVMGPNGEVETITGTTRDVTERRRAEERLRASEERLGLALEASQVGIWEYDPEAKRGEVSALCRRLLGISGDGPLLEEQFLGTVHPDDRSRVEAAIGNALHPAGEGRYGAHYRVVWPDGAVRWLAALGRVHFAGEGTARRPKRLVGTLMDLTDSVESENLLRDSDRRKSQFLAMLSHELRNPLAPIRNSLVVLDHAAPGSAMAQRARDVLHRQTAQLSRLVDDLLDISRIEHGKIELQREVLDARDLVRRAYTDARALFEQREVELVLSQPSGPVWVKADATRLAQMLGNLLHNALKFTARGGHVQVKLARTEGSCELCVKDTGHGIERGDLDRIFEPFVQTEGQAEPGGLGLGLALVRELALLHGGSVRAESEGRHMGAAFVITLPLAPPAEQAAEQRAAAAAPPGLDVVIVEDNEDAASTLADLLSLGGNRVVTAFTGSDGVNAVSAQRPQVLICDLGLPDMSGLDVIRAIRAQEQGESRVFAMALTGYAQPRDRDEALAAGFDAHLAKPPPLEELERMLAEAARRVR